MNKKIITILIVALLAITCVFAGAGKFNVGGNVGYSGFSSNSLVIDVGCDWQMDYTEGTDYTVDLYVDAGYISDFTVVNDLETFVGVGFTKCLSKDFTTSAFIGLENYWLDFDMGVAIDMQFKARIVNDLYGMFSIRVGQVFFSNNTLFRPSIGAFYSI